MPTQILGHSLPRERTPLARERSAWHLLAAGLATVGRSRSEECRGGASDAGRGGGGQDRDEGAVERSVLGGAGALVVREGGRGSGRLRVGAGAPTESSRRVWRGSGWRRG